MKRALFIDRDGTLIDEPKEDQQVDSLAKLRYIPGVFSGLGKIAALLDYELVLVTNQDGLGTSSFPEADFWPAHEKMIEALQGEGIEFATTHIDRSFADEQNPNRKPGIGMLSEYCSGSYDLARCFVIGDRLTDVELAKNLGAKAVYFMNSTAPAAPATLLDTVAVQTDSWEEIYRFLRRNERRAVVRRKTAETDVQIEVALDGSGETQLQTGIGFFDHMLAQIGKHSGIDLRVTVEGDLEVDEHHTIEDTAIALGEAFDKALGSKRGIARYAFVLPMDESLAAVALDFSGRAALVWDAEFRREKIGEMPCEMFSHFFKSFAHAARCNLNIKADGGNEHHKIEAIFKGFAKCLGQAAKLDYSSDVLPSTKDVL